VGWVLSPLTLTTGIIVYPGNRSVTPRVVISRRNAGHTRRRSHSVISICRHTGLPRRDAVDWQVSSSSTWVLLSLSVRSKLCLLRSGIGVRSTAISVP